MNFLNKYLYHKILIVIDFNNLSFIDNIKKICLNFGFKDYLNNILSYLSSIIFFKFFFSSNNIFIKSKKQVLILKIKKKDFVGNKLIILKKHEINLFFLIFKKFIFLNSNSGFLNVNSLVIRFNDLFLLKKIQIFFDFFKFLPSLSVNIVLNSSNIEYNKLFFKILGFRFKY